MVSGSAYTRYPCGPHKADVTATKHIIGIDPGFGETGVVLYTDATPDILDWATFSCPPHGQAAAARAASLAEHVLVELIKWVATYQITNLDVCIEIPFLKRGRVDSYQKQMRVVQELESGILFRLSSEVMELWVTEVSPTQAKLLACNYGQATKEQVVAASPFSAYPMDAQTTLEAVADAWAIGQAAWAVKGKRFNFKSVKAAKIIRRSHDT